MRISNIFLAMGLILFMYPVLRAQAIEQKPAELKVVTSFYPVYIMAKNVANNVPGVIVSNLTPPVTGCLHDYALTTEDMKKLSDADVFVANGAGMESFLNRILTQFPNLKVIELAQGIPLIKDDASKSDNPHVWVSISNAMTEVNYLGKALESMDPLHADEYQRNTESYVSKLGALKQKMHAALLPYAGKEIITFHEAFPYFAREFGFKVAAVVEREPGSEPSARDLAQTVDLIKKSGVRYLFSEPQYPDAAAKAIAQETGVIVYVLDPGVTGGDDKDAYVQVMEKNLNVLLEALSRP